MNSLAIIVGSVLVALGIAVVIFAAGFTLGRKQVRRNPIVYGHTRDAQLELQVPSDVTDEDAAHLHAAFLAAVRTGRIHLNRSPEIPQ